MNGDFMYTTLNEHYRSRFGCKVYKLSLDAGFTCPNRDGTKDTRGCIFCSGAGSGDFAERWPGDVALQIEKAKTRVKSKNKSGKYVAYFQAFTNTYAPVDKLESIYRAAMVCDDVVAIAVATRPDCLETSVLDLLDCLNREMPVYVELGLQTVHPGSVQYIRRGYENEEYFNAVRELRARNIHVVTHIILGLPGENAEMAVETTRQAVVAGTHGVKFHLLHVLRGTDLEKDFRDGKCECLSMEAYGEMLKACLAVLSKEIVVHRITGDGAKKDLIAPLWSADKKRVLNYLNRILRE